MERGVIGLESWGNALMIPHVGDVCVVKQEGHCAVEQLVVGEESTGCGCG